MYFLQILKLEENSRTKLFCPIFLFQLQNLEKESLDWGVKNWGRLGNLNHTFFWPRQPGQNKPDLVADP